MKLEDLKMCSLSEFLRAAPKTGPKIAVGDIETFPALSYHFNFWNVNIGYENTVEDTSLMSSAFKWLEQPECFYVDQSKKKNVRDDLHQLEQVRRVLQEADFVVAHNGIKFDLRKLRGYMALRGLAPFEPARVIDTLRLNKRVFEFDRQSLQWTTERTTDTPKSSHSLFPGFKMWRECLAGNKEAWKENRIYNITDITSLEEMYLNLRGWYEQHPNLGPFMEVAAGEHVCPNCGSSDVYITKRNRKTDVGIYNQYRCNPCGKYSRGRYLVKNKEERSHILIS